MGIYNKGVVWKIFSWEIKILIKQALKLMLKRIPNPTHSRLELKNSKILLDTFNEILKHQRPHALHISGNKELIAIRNFVVVLYETDLYYRERINEFVKLLKKSDWETIKGEETPRKEWWK
jgi:hypothetical protein